MSILKKIGKKVVKTGFETVKESVEELGKTVTAERMTGQLLGQEKAKEQDKKDSNEFKEYLKKLDPNLTEEEKKKIIRSEKEGIEKAERVIQRAATPPHMRLEKDPHKKPSQDELHQYHIYYKVWKEIEEREKERKALEAKEGKLKEPPTARKRGDWKKGLRQRKSAEMSRDFKTG